MRLLLCLVVAVLLPVLLMAAAETVKVYGHVKDVSNNGVSGVEVSVTLAADKGAVDTTSETESQIIISVPVDGIQTDTNGYWSVDLLVTNKYLDTSQGKCNIVGTYGGVEVFSIHGMFIDSACTGDSLNLADSLAGR